MSDLRQINREFEFGDLYIDDLPVTFEVSWGMGEFASQSGHGQIAYTPYFYADVRLHSVKLGALSLTREQVIEAAGEDYVARVEKSASIELTEALEAA